MEVCGGHTHSIYKYGVDDLLPENVELVHGPGCPVCVIPMGRVDDGIAVAQQPGVIFTCFGDMMPEWEPVRRLAESGLASPVTTSMGRLFDAVAALCGIRATVTYEGQAAIELEAAADRHERRAYPMPVTTGSGAAAPALVLDARPTIAAVHADLSRAADVSLVSARFHNAVAQATAGACREIGAPAVVLSGGVFQNALLLARTIEALEGMRVLTPRRLPFNDGGISFGQAAVAAARS
jgi:hydrogenase maturation protein HypF